MSGHAAPRRAITALTTPSGAGAARTPLIEYSASEARYRIWIEYPVPVPRGGPVVGTALVLHKGGMITRETYEPTGAVRSTMIAMPPRA